MTSSPLTAYGFSTPAMDAIFSPEGVVEAMLSFEAALALALADAGVAPRDHAERVAAACQAPVTDPEGLLATTWTAGTPVIALVEELIGRLPADGDHEWVHYGATSQDVIDTAHMLCARNGLEELERSLTGVATHMKGLVERNREQAQIGRTFLQHARPTTFGMRAASWLDAALRHISGMRRARSQLMVQLGGPVGNLADYGPKGTEVAAALADRLGLQAPPLPWHTDRSPIWDLVWAVDRPVASVAKVARDIALLVQSDTAELTVRSGGSSSMSEKRNPIDTIRAAAAADICHGAAAMITGAGPHELDRAVGAWHVEWVALPLLFRSASAALESAESFLDTLEIDPEAMSGRADAHTQGPDDLDPRLIDRVLSTFDEVVKPQ